MPTFDFAQTNFTRGELSPRLQGRIDFQGFYNGVETLLNMVSLPFGGVMKRPGTRFVSEVKNQDKPTRLIPFEFSTRESYVLALNDGVIRFFLDEGKLVTEDIGTASITNGTFDRGNAALSHNSTDERMKFDGGGSSDKAIAEQDISIDNTNTAHSLSFYILTVDETPDAIMRVKVGSTSGDGDIKDVDLTSGFHIIQFDPDGNSTVYLQFEYEGVRNLELDNIRFQNDQELELDHPWSDDDLFNLKWVQSADVVWIVENDTWPYQLKRFSETEFSLERFDFIDGPYGDVNKTETTLNPSTTTGDDVTITASDTVGINDDEGFSDEDIGRWVRLKHSGKWGAGQIVKVNNNKEVVVKVRDKDFNGSGTTKDWRLGSWSPGQGFPSATTFHNQRLVFGSSKKKPQALWFSVVGDFPNFQPTDEDGDVKDDDSINITISSSQVNSIRWIESLASGLAVGTSGAVFLFRSATTTDPLCSSYITCESW